MKTNHWSQLNAPNQSAFARVRNLPISLARLFQLVATFILVTSCTAAAAPVGDIRVRRDNSPLTEGRTFRPAPGPDGVRFNKQSTSNFWFGYLKKNGTIVQNRQDGDGYVTADFGFQGAADGVGDYELMLRLKGITDSKKIIHFSVRAAAAVVEFTDEPEGDDIEVGDTYTFSAAADHVARWQWFFNGTAISGATNPNLTLTNVSKGNAGNYQVAAYNADDVPSFSGAATLKVAWPLVDFTTDPEDEDVEVSDTVTFTAAASNAVRWQWYFSGVPIPGANSPLLTLTNVTKANAGQYQAAAFNADDIQGFSDMARLTVDWPKVEFTEEPDDAAVELGATFTLRAAARNAVRWQWYFKGAPIAGANSPLLTLTNLTKGSAGQYQVGAFNADDLQELSSTADLTVAAPTVEFTQDPADEEVAVGATITLRAAAKNAVRWQWYFNRVALAGANAPTLTLTGVTKAQAGSYQAGASNLDDVEELSDSALLTVIARPAITQDPENVTVAPGEPFTLAVGTDDPNAEFQWKRNGVALAGETEAALERDEAQTQDAGSYVCVVSNAAGSTTTKPAKVTVKRLAPPVITTQPKPTKAKLGGTATFTVAATGDGTLTYQWQKDGIDLDGEEEPTLTLSDITATDQGSYQVVVSNGGGETKSKSAPLTVEAGTSRVGQFAGIFHAPDVVAHESSGAIKLTATANGRFTGSAQIGSVKYAFTASFDAAGQAEFQAVSKVKNTAPLTITLAMGDDAAIEGTVAANGWESELHLELCPFTAASPCPMSGDYTVLLAPDDTNEVAPPAYGHLTMKIAANGAVSATGKLADGSPATVSTWISGKGDIALYLPLYRGRGVALGWLAMENENVSGAISWIKPATETGTYPEGFATSLTTLGAPFRKSEPLLPDEAVLIVEGANLDEPLTVPITVGPRNKLTANLPGVRVQVGAKGSFSGSFIDPVTHRSVTFAGAFLQPDLAGFGAFQAGAVTGEVYLGTPLDGDSAKQPKN